MIENYDQEGWTPIYKYGYPANYVHGYHYYSHVDDARDRYINDDNKYICSVCRAERKQHEKRMLQLKRERRRRGWNI